MNIVLSYGKFQKYLQSCSEIRKWRTEFLNKKTVKSTYKVTMRRLRAKIVAVDKNNYYTF